MKYCTYITYVLHKNIGPFQIMIFVDIPLLFDIGSLFTSMRCVYVTTNNLLVVFSCPKVTLPQCWVRLKVSLVKIW